MDSPIQRQQRVAQMVLGYVSGGLFAGSAVFATAGAVFTPWLLIPAGALGLASGIVLAVRTGVAAARLPRTLPGGPARIGIGAEVDGSATIEPGAVVEMGATVKAGAMVQSGAVVRMGATVGRNAVVESGAAIGWGATIEDGARVQRDASVGAGATVGAQAVLDAGRHLGAGSTLHSAGPRARRVERTRSNEEAQSVEAARAPASASEDPAGVRLRQVDMLCDRLEAELRTASPALREFLSATEKSVGALRSSGRDLIQRERTLRREVAPEVMERLKTERSAIEQKVTSVEDEQVRASLQQALAAIDEQQAQRRLLARNAERLDAELTRLCWSIDGAIAQLVQVRSAGAVSINPELERGLGRIRDELASVSEAMESVNDEERAALRRSAPISPVGEGQGAPDRTPPGRLRS